MVIGTDCTGSDQGQIQDFKLGGTLKKIAPSGGRRGNFWVFRISRKKIIFFPIVGGGALPYDHDDPQVWYIVWST